MVEQRLEQLLTLAISEKATDVHLHFNDNEGKIQLRTIHGFVSYESTEMDPVLYQFLKYKSNLDLTASMIPQSGTFSYVIKDKPYHCRFSVLETMSIRSGVIRILNLSLIESLDDIGHPLSILHLIRQKLKNRSGLILFSGLTGSGKTTTMFTALAERTLTSIYTLEDPIESFYENLMQIQINQATGLDYQQGIKQLLRHDPDIITIGEIRSQDEAKAMLRCCLSGHLVTSTIHASSLESTLFRLMDFEITKFDLSLIDITIIFQQLIVDNDQRRAQLEIMENDQVQAYLKQLD